MKIQRFNTKLTAISSVILPLLAPPVLAQNSGSGLALEEVIVTARKREESLQDVPVAVTRPCDTGNGASVPVTLEIGGSTPSGSDLLVRDVTTGRPERVLYSAAAAVGPVGFSGSLDPRSAIEARFRMKRFAWWLASSTWPRRTAATAIGASRRSCIARAGG